LGNARKKAEKMAMALGASIDKVWNIYEEKPNSSATGIMELYKMTGAYGKENITPYMTPITDEGKVTYSQSTFVRFTMK
jgi:uncharacterized protein YggE